MQTGFVRKYVLLFLITILGYFGEVCIMPYIKIFGVSPNLLYVVIGIVTVAYGILMQIMLPSVTMLNLALYSLTTLFCSFAFADKPLKTLEYERALNRRKKEPPAWLRTFLCTVLNTFIYETVQITYIYLGGSVLTINYFLRGFADIFGTGLLCLLLLFPARFAIFGRKKNRPVMQPTPVVFTKH